MPSKKYCIFCGSSPDKKNKEHVIPRWLIELTGDPKRHAFFGFAKDFGSNSKNGIRKYSFDQFTFPACTKCNEDYSELEGDAKSVMLAILSAQAVKSSDVSRFLDWLDKVRVGLWLGINQLDKNSIEITPKFHIDTRIGQSDRMLIIEKSDAPSSKLNFAGVTSFSFSFSPTAFCLIVNNYYFTNISTFSLFSQRLGFPYAGVPVYDPESSQTLVEIYDGSERMMLPLLRRSIKEKGTIVFQPMFKGGLLEGGKSHYDTLYVRGHSLDFDHGIGSLFLQLPSNKVREVKSAEMISLEPDVVQSEDFLFLESAIRITDWQLWLMEKTFPSLERCTADEKAFHQDQRKGVSRADRLWLDYLVRERSGLPRTRRGKMR